MILDRWIDDLIAEYWMKIAWCVLRLSLFMPCQMDEMCCQRLSDSVSVYHRIYFQVQHSSDGSNCEIFYWSSELRILIDFTDICSHHTLLEFVRVSCSPLTAAILGIMVVQYIDKARTLLCEHPGTGASGKHMVRRKLVDIPSSHSLPILMQMKWKGPIRTSFKLQCTHEQNDFIKWSSVSARNALFHLLPLSRSFLPLPNRFFVRPKGKNEKKKL